MTDAKTTETWKMNDFLQKVKKVVRIVFKDWLLAWSDWRKPVPISSRVIITKKSEW